MIGDGARWDERHAAAIAAGDADRAPASWITRHLPVLRSQAPGRALDVACGRGRHALLLARLGFDVEALDASAVAVDHLRGRAEAEDLPVDARVADLRDEPLPEGPFAVVVDAFFLERRLFAAMAERLAPGGVLLVVTYLATTSDASEWWLRPGELATAFEGLDVLELLEGPPAPGERPQAALAARRPLAPELRAV